MTYIVFCKSGPHESGTLDACEQCQMIKKRREEMARSRQTEESAPIIDATTPGLYRDETFWIFNYPDEEERTQAMEEYYSYQELLAEIESMPDIREEDE